MLIYCDLIAVKARRPKPGQSRHGKSGVWRRVSRPAPIFVILTSQKLLMGAQARPRETMRHRQSAVQSAGTALHRDGIVLVHIINNYDDGSQGCQRGSGGVSCQDERPASQPKEQHFYTRKDELRSVSFGLGVALLVR